MADLSADYGVLCSGDAYDRLKASAWAFVAIWPVGVPVLYLLLLNASQKAWKSGIPTPLSRATEFLSNDYKPNAYWWEPFEMCRKWTLTGAVLLIDEHYELARVLVALLVSITFLAFHLSLKPIRRPEDGALFLVAEMALILVYICVLLIKTCEIATETESLCPCDRVCTVCNVCATFGFGHTSAGIYIFFIFFGIGMVGFMLVVGGTKLWMEGYLPQVLLVARAHSVPVSTILWRVWSRRLAYAKGRVFRKLDLDSPRLSIAEDAAVYRFRIERLSQAFKEKFAARPHAQNLPPDLAPVVEGHVAELYIDGAFPRTT